MTLPPPREIPGPVMLQGGKFWPVLPVQTSVVEAGCQPYDAQAEIARLTATITRQREDLDQMMGVFGSLCETIATFIVPPLKRLQVDVTQLDRDVVTLHSQVEKHDAGIETVALLQRAGRRG